MPSDKTTGKIVKKLVYKPLKLWYNSFNDYRNVELFNKTKPNFSSVRTKAFEMTM
jgi:hypothetical protein